MITNKSDPLSRVVFVFHFIEHFESVKARLCKTVGARKYFSNGKMQDRIAAKPEMCYTDSGKRNLRFPLHHFGTEDSRDV